MSETNSIKRTKQEIKVLKKLDIPDFRHMTKDKLMTFVGSLDKLDPEVAKAAIQQFPEFATMTKNALLDYKEVMLQTLSSDTEENQRVFSFYEKTQKALESLLQDPDMELTFEQKQWCIDKMQELSEEISKIAHNNKMHRLQLVGATLAGIAVSIGGMIAALGGKFDINNRDS